MPSFAMTETRSCTALSRCTAVPGYLESYISDNGGVLAVLILLSFVVALHSLSMPFPSAEADGDAAATMVDFPRGFCASRADRKSNDGLER